MVGKVNLSSLIQCRPCIRKVSNLGDIFSVLQLENLYIGIKYSKMIVLLIGYAALCLNFKIFFRDRPFLHRVFIVERLGFVKLFSFNQKQRTRNPCGPLKLIKHF